ncbi:multidrug ABC transporter ATP-binding protein [Candidatus Atribacteria bacterium RBG_16_35_8]|nr:MAG: multidrug ABC transporter ATP-binding protein [Candidatus Atribacteria bacterium RBG_16_35_8]
MSEYAIVAEDLYYSYGDLIAVDHINFKVARGEILGFLGPNGAGKTTTINMLTGQIKPKGGRAILLDMDITENVEKIKGDIGVCFETTNLYEQMTAIENLNLFARLFNIKSFDARTLLKRVGLEGREKNRVETYSKGMKQRLMVARSIVNQPEVLFLDEPTAGLDPTSSRAIHNIIMQERKRGATVFLTTHDMMEADKLSDRVAFMNQGRIVAMDTPLNLKQKYGKRALKAKVIMPGGKLEDREIALDTADTPGSVKELFSNENVVTVHSKEATLEDIFIKITGRGLVE